MKKSGRIVVLLAIVMWTFMPSGLVGATINPFYVNCSTGAPPFTPATVAANTSQEVQAFCNAGDIALGGGYEVLSPPLPLPAGLVTTTPENSFYFSDTTPPDGRWSCKIPTIHLRAQVTLPSRQRLTLSARRCNSESACPVWNYPNPHVAHGMIAFFDAGERLSFRLSPKHTSFGAACGFFGRLARQASF